MSINKHFYFDLEETLITSWNNLILINKDKISKFIKDNCVKEVGIFSAAIVNQSDKDFFISNIKGWLESVYDISIDVTRIVTLEELVKLYKMRVGIFMNVTEMLSLYGKDGAFVKYCKLTYKQNDHCILLDDSFDDEVINNHSRKLVIEIVNIKRYH